MDLAKSDLVSNTYITYVQKTNILLLGEITTVLYFNLDIDAKEHD